MGVFTEISRRRRREENGSARPSKRRRPLRSLHLSPLYPHPQSLGTHSPASIPLSDRARADKTLQQLYQLYLQPPNTALLHTLYITRTTSNPFVQWTLAHQLRRAAETELLRSFSTPTIAERDILHQAGEAFAALSTLLCEDEWFFGHSQPGIFDAGVFGYTQLLLDAGLRWGAGGNALGEMVRGYGNLVRHREQIARLYF